MKIDVKVLGMNELERRLKKLKGTVAKKEIEKALRSASNKLKKRAISNAPVKSGSLRNAIFVAKRVQGVRRVSKNTVGMLHMGVHYSGPKAAPHAHLVEYGTKNRRVKPDKVGGKTKRVRIGGRWVNAPLGRGRTKPVRFMNRAFDVEGSSRFVERFRKTLSKKVDKLGL